ARTGSPAAHGSGDYVIAFSTARGQTPIADEALTPLFQAVVESTEEAVYNSLLKAQTTTGLGGRVAEALPVDRVRQILRKYGR
ncbi:MAG: P1 family peptidase, partial [Bryobacteraceae bacterium]